MGYTQEELSDRAMNMSKLMDLWMSKDRNSTLTDLIAYIKFIDRQDVVDAVLNISKTVATDDHMITRYDRPSRVMLYDAYILYADKEGDDETFAYEVKKYMEENYHYKVIDTHQSFNNNEH